MFTDPNRKGDLAEQWVALLASWKGAEVFRNVNCTGAADLVLKYNDTLYEIDVKRARQGIDGSWYADTNLVKDPVIPVLVIPVGDISEWKVKWIRNRHPEELTSFWDKHIHSTTHGQIQDGSGEDEVPIQSQIQTHSPRQWDPIPT